MKAWGAHVSTFSQEDSKGLTQMAAASTHEKQKAADLSRDRPAEGCQHIPS